VTGNEERLRYIDASERILLLPHCLRRSGSCQGKYGEDGLECRGCNPDCPVNHLTRAAARFGYKGVCVAPGGRLAVHYVRKMQPVAIVAVACDKELEEGVRGVRGLSEGADTAPVIVVIPLSRDGCIDTEVNEERALAIIALGCSKELIEEGV
jgi:hypothetical protein